MKMNENTVNQLQKYKCTFVESKLSLYGKVETVKFVIDPTFSIFLIAGILLDPIYTALKFRSRILFYLNTIPLRRYDERTFSRFPFSNAGNYCLCVSP